MIVWNTWRSMAHSLQSMAAGEKCDRHPRHSRHTHSKSISPLMVAVRLQLYRMASSPITLPGAMVLRNLPSRDTSTLPSATKEKTNKQANDGGLAVCAKTYKTKPIRRSCAPIERAPLSGRYENGLPGLTARRKSRRALTKSVRLASLRWPARYNFIRAEFREYKINNCKSGARSGPRAVNQWALDPFARVPNERAFKDGAPRTRGNAPLQLNLSLSRIGANSSLSSDSAAIHCVYCARRQAPGIGQLKVKHRSEPT